MLARFLYGKFKKKILHHKTLNNHKTTNMDKMNDKEEKMKNAAQAENTDIDEKDGCEACANEETTAENAQENEGDKEEELSALDKALAEIEKLKDQYLRSVAEFDNYRKRTIKEKAELILNGSEKALQALLPIIDDMERALENADKTDDPQVLKEGMELIYQKTNKMMEGLGVKKIDTQDADFNTDYHEAVAMVPGMGDDKKGKVLDCVQTGYMLNDKVLRHAKVAVGQ